MFLAGCAACASGSTYVVKTPDTAMKVSTVQLVEDKDLVAVPAEVKTTFKEKLTSRICPSASAGEVKLSYQFIQFEAGNQFVRWATGGSWNPRGEGSMTVQVKYLDSAGQVLAAIQTDGRIGSGLFGGSFDQALSKAADSVADYTAKTFTRDPPCRR